MKNKLIIPGFILLLLLSNIIVIESNAKKAYKFFFEISPYIIICGFLLLFMPMKKIFRYVLIGIIAFNLLIKWTLELIYASSIKLTTPKMSFYLFLVVIFVLMYGKNRTQKEKVNDRFS